MVTVEDGVREVGARAAQPRRNGILDRVVQPFHVRLGPGGITDLAGNRLEIFDFRPPGTVTVHLAAQNRDIEVPVPLDMFSIEYQLDPTAAENLVASRVFRFAGVDEDGTKPGSVDFFGQFQIQDGALVAAPTNRRSLVADDQTLGSILRYDKGECLANGASPAPPSTTKA